MRSIRRSSHRNGFTLIELLLAMAITGVMVTIMVQVFSSVLQDKRGGDKGERGDDAGVGDPHRHAADHRALAGGHDRLGADCGAPRDHAEHDGDEERADRVEEGLLARGEPGGEEVDDDVAALHLAPRQEGRDADRAGVLHVLEIALDRPARDRPAGDARHRHGDHGDEHRAAAEREGLGEELERPPQAGAGRPRGLGHYFFVYFATIFCASA